MQSMLIKTARSALGNESYMWGHKKVLTEMKWLSVDEYRNIAIQKFTHKVINTKEPEYLYTKMTQNRSPRILQENKVTSYHPRFGFKLPSRRSIRYESMKLYNNCLRN